VTALYGLFYINLAFVALLIGKLIFIRPPIVNNVSYKHVPD